MTKKYNVELEDEMFLEEIFNDEDYDWWDYVDPDEWVVKREESITEEYMAKFQIEEAPEKFTSKPKERKNRESKRKRIHLSRKENRRIKRKLLEQTDA